MDEQQIRSDERLRIARAIFADAEINDGLYFDDAGKVWVGVYRVLDVDWESLSPDVAAS